MITGVGAAPRTRRKTSCRRSSGSIRSRSTRSGGASATDAQRLLAVVGEPDLEPLILEVPLEDVTDHDFVVHDEHPCFGHLTMVPRDAFRRAYGSGAHGEGRRARDPPDRGRRPSRLTVLLGHITSSVGERSLLQTVSPMASYLGATAK